MQIFGAHEPSDGGGSPSVTRSRIMILKKIDASSLLDFGSSIEYGFVAGGFGIGLS